MSVKIIDTLLFGLPIVAVIDDNLDPPRVTSIRSGSFEDGRGHHELANARWNAEKSGQQHIVHVKLYDDAEEVEIPLH